MHAQQPLPPSPHSMRTPMPAATAPVSRCSAPGACCGARGSFIIVGLLVPLCTPTIGDPLTGLGRYVTVLFPLYMAAAAWAVEHRARRLLLIGCGTLLILFTAQFATWHIVGARLL